MPDRIEQLQQVATHLRCLTLQMVHRARASHIGACLSMTELIAALYWQTLRIRPADPGWADRDRFLLSKGHAAAMLYAALAHRGFFPESELDTYCDDGSNLTGHATTGVPGVELSTGSLGHALPVACGLALAAKREGHSWRAFVLLGDGEMDEGSNWESLLFAAQHGLENLTAIVDYNKIQSFGRTADVLDLEPLAGKFDAFRWGIEEVDGHDLHAIVAALDRLPFKPGRPSALIAHTIKGKGVSFMEDDLAWHYKSPTDAQLRRAICEIGGSL